MSKRQILTLIVIGISAYMTLACVSTIALTPTASVPVFAEDGIYILENSGNYQKISAIDDDSIFDLSTIPTASSRNPIFAIRGSNFSIDDLRLRGYYAGIGIDSEFTFIGTGQSGAKIVQIYENSPAAEAGLQPGEIIFSIDGDPFTAIHLNYGFPPYRDLVDLINPNQNEITIGVLSGTTERSVTLPRSYRLSGDNFKTNQALSSFTIEPNGDYILLKVTWPLNPGIYRLEFDQNETQKWLFVVR